MKKDFQNNKNINQITAKISYGFTIGDFFGKSKKFQTLSSIILEESSPLRAITCLLYTSTVVFAAVCNGEMIGFANGSWVLDEGELLNIAVLEKYRRQGLAEILLKTLEDFFTEKNITVIYLEVREKNQSALSFYEKHGFIKNGFRKNYYRNPDDNGVLMMKKIGDKYAYTDVYKRQA